MSEDGKIFAIIKNYIDRIVDIFYYSGCILEISVSIVIISQFFKSIKSSSPSSSIASAYFYILFWGYLFDALYELGFTCQRYLTKDWSSDNIIDIPFFKYFECFIEWYIMLFMGPSNILLSLNRFTSIFYITKHKIIWSTKKYFLVILFLLLFYPFIINGYSFSNITCRLDTYAPECSEYIKQDYLIRAISNGICGIISLIIGITTFIIYRKKFKYSRKNQIQRSQLNRKIKVEYKLLIQSVWTETMFGFYAFLTMYVPFSYEIKDDPDFWLFDRIFNILYDFSYISYHYVSIILLFFFSYALKREYLKLYHLEWIAQKLCLTKINTESTISITNMASIKVRRQSFFPEY